MRHAHETLRNAIAQLPPGSFALMIVDEENRRSGGLLGPRVNTIRSQIPLVRLRQTAVAAACRTADPTHPTISISFNQTVPNYLSEPEARNRANMYRRIEFSKNTVGAFEVDRPGHPNHGDLGLNGTWSSLALRLQEPDMAGIQTLIVMGFEMNACVLATVGASRAGNNFGALQLQFQVLTSGQLMHSGEILQPTIDAAWDYAIPNLHYYDTV
ncbi:MAG TPA: hypothetical protein VL346_01415 [Acidobacteriaceae bacterium]|nr:hypothetical protein [Acidobacteriaceae bacterium]